MSGMLILSTTSFSLFGKDGFVISLAPYFLILAVGAVLFSIVPLFAKWFLQKRRIGSSLITMKFSVPGDLTPAEIQYLFLPTEKSKVIEATITDLLNRDYLRVEDSNGVETLHADSVPNNVLRRYEKMIVVQSSKPGGVTAASIVAQPVAYTGLNSQNEQQNDVTGFFEYVHESLQQLNLVNGRGIDKFFIECIKITIMLLFAFVWWPVMLLWFMSIIESGSSDFTSVISFVGLSAIITAVAIVPLFFLAMLTARFRSKFFGRRWLSAPKLKSLWPQLVAYRNFVKLAYNGKLEFESEKIKNDSSKRIEAYAMAFGFIKD